MKLSHSIKDFSDISENELKQQIEQVHSKYANSGREIKAMLIISLDLDDSSNC